jgi:hypothetical protein
MNYTTGSFGIYFRKNRDVSLLYQFEAFSQTRPAPYSVGTGVLFLEIKQQDGAA